MATTRARRNNLFAGAFVLAAIVTGVLIVVLIGGSLEAFGKATYTVRFPVETGVGGLNTGSQVSVGGLQVGTVKSVKHIIENGTIQSIEVRAAVSKKVPLRQGAIASLELPLLGGGGTINFTELGDGAPLMTKDIIPGRLAPPGFLASAGFGDEQREQVQALLESASQGAQKFNDTMNIMRSEWSTNISDMIDDTKTHYPDWLNRIDNATSNIERTTSRGPEITASFEQRIDEFAKLVAETRAVIQENREGVRAAVANTQEASANIAATTKDAQAFVDRLNGELADKAIALLDEARAAVGEARSALAQADDLMLEQRPVIRRTMANARLASDQLRDLAAEVRRSPWRLVYRPNDRELENELLYDAARLFAGAVGDLQSTSEALQTVLGASPDTVNAQQVASLVEALDAAFERYHDAENALLDQLIKK
ncbi:MAG: MCE family protein [Phycisphaerales bacterium]|nr:MCE family protein [Phycisphaerales bacterium]